MGIYHKTITDNLYFFYSQVSRLTKKMAINHLVFIPIYEN